METINEIFDALRDGEWHDLGAISREYRLSQTQVELIMKFLGEYSIITLDKEHQRVKLTPPVLRFLEEIQQIEETEFGE